MNNEFCAIAGEHYMIALGLSFLAGLLTSLSPCVLPVLPIIVGSSLRENRWAPIAMATGMISAFVTVGFTLSAFGGLFGADSDFIRTGSAILLGVFGLVLLNQKFQDNFAKLLSPVTRASESMINHPKLSGLTGQFFIGILLGALWSPCSGPTLGSAITLAAQADTRTQSVALLFTFGVGASMPMLLIAYGAQTFIRNNRRTLFQSANFAKVFLGFSLLVISGLILSGADKIIEAHLLALLPEWLIKLTTKF